MVVLIAVWSALAAFPLIAIIGIRNARRDYAERRFGWAISTFAMTLIGCLHLVLFGWILWGVAGGR